MIKKTFKRILSSAVATGLLMGGIPFLSANAATNESVEAIQLSQENLQQLNYAIEEMRIAIDLVDNADFTNIDNYNRLLIFATTSLERSRGLGIENQYIDSIEESGNEVRELTYRITRVLQAINNVEIVFSEERNDTKENKENVINTLNEVLTQEIQAGELNENTLRSAVNILHQYVAKL